MPRGANPESSCIWHPASDANNSSKRAKRDSTIEHLEIGLLKGTLSCQHSVQEYTDRYKFEKLLYIFASVKAERTRQLIIEKTAPLFNKKGFDGTTLSDMEKATGLTKGSLYGNFRDKDEIASEAFQYSMRKVKLLVREKVDAVVTNKEQLEALLDFYAEYVFDPPVAGRLSRC